MSPTLRKPDLAAQCREEAFAFGEIIWARRHRAPYGLRPSRIVTPPRDDMDVKLRHHVAYRRDIELIACRHSLEGTRHRVDLGHELCLRGHVEVDDLTGAGAPRHQQQPRVIGIAA